MIFARSNEAYMIHKNFLGRHLSHPKLVIKLEINLELPIREFPNKSHNIPIDGRPF